MTAEESESPGPFPTITIESLTCAGVARVRVDTAYTVQLLVGIMKKSPGSFFFDVSIVSANVVIGPGNETREFAADSPPGVDVLGVQAFLIPQEGPYQGYGSGTQTNQITACLTGGTPELERPIQITAMSVSCEGVVTYSVSDGTVPFEYLRDFSISIGVSPQTGDITHEWLRAE